MIKVKDITGNEVKGIVRDRNGAIVSVDRSEYEAYRAKKQKALEQEQRIQKLESSIDEIKSLLVQLINKG